MELIEIPVDEINFHATSFCDNKGRVFWWNEELYRGIVKDRVDFYSNLFEQGIIQNLVDKKLLIETERTNLTLNNYPLVVKHRRLTFVSYANEWCPEMLRDAALLIVDLLMELFKDNLAIDAGTWDILFDGCHPIFVDICSIDPINSYYGECQALRDDFLSYFISPLKLMSQGYGNLARWLLSDYEHRIIHAEFAALMGSQIYNFQHPNSLLSIAKRNLPQSTLSFTIRGLKFIQSKLSKLNPNNKDLIDLNLIQKLQRDVQSITMPSTIRQISEQQDHDPPLNPAVSWTQKHRSVYQLLSDLHPVTVLDIGCGQGWYSRLAASLGSKVVALDVDDRQVAHCYQAAQQQDLPILSLVMDIRYPSPGHGTGNRLIAPALKRLPCDLVLVLSLVQLLVFEQHLTFEQMVETFASFSKKWLLVEFISHQDCNVNTLISDSYSRYMIEDYTLEKFIDRLKKWFQNLEIIPSDSEYSVLILCTK